MENIYSLFFFCLGHQIFVVQDSINTSALFFAEIPTRIKILGFSLKVFSSLIHYALLRSCLSYPHYQGFTNCRIYLIFDALLTILNEKHHEIVDFV
jgi:hypothetical protein